ncbi:HAMP domain-containing protein [Aliifodinibius sp. S!AR15-10]|uniref:sensor histidine kinase n=1 Tax=Aliifodinibius sp. S!AR15-10 TaxID=2950437 RepID=UPI002857A6FD|nr:histidine kinase dimerization/phosphoacceptor domain -containing protein [Aliifodinibius sp. S!AR15-10]MDR8393560.1 HAMP domain-containing protein [Aliifodinibius sp. S!AR15-10]
MPEFSIRWKLLAGFVGLALLVLLVVLFSVSRILDNRIRDEINANFREAGKIFEQLQDIRFRQLHQTATLVAEMPYMKAAISTMDENTVNNQIRQELVDLLHFDPMISDSLSAGSIAAGSDSVGLVLVLDQDGIPLGQLADTELPDSSMLDKPGVREALNARAPQRSYIWKQGDSYFNVITIPVLLRGQVIASLSLGYPIRNIEAELLARLIEYDVSYFVDNKLLATSIGSLSDQDRAVLSENIQTTVFQDSSSSEGTTIELELDGKQWLLYVLPMVEQGKNGAGITGYYTVAQSLNQALAPLRELQQVIYYIGLGGILIAVILGITLTNNLTKPIKLLLKGINRIENENYDEPVEVVSSDEFGQLTETFNKLVSHIKENLREKEILLAEIHHRVKNNLAVISGLLELEGQNSEDGQSVRILKNSQMRIHSMATVHEMLYQSNDFNNLSFDDFVAKMVSSIQGVYTNNGSPKQVTLDISDVQLNVNQAVPCGLIINELVTNAFKHAYPGSRTGLINITLEERDNHIFLCVTDEGVGLPDDFSFEENKNESLGFTLVEILARQINAELNVNTEGGTSISVLFEKKNKKGASSSLNLN